MSGKPPIPPSSSKPNPAPARVVPPSLLSPDDLAVREAVLELLSVYFKSSQLQDIGSGQSPPQAIASSADNVRSTILTSFRPRFRRSGPSIRTIDNFATFRECLETGPPLRVINTPLNFIPMIEVQHLITGATLLIPEFFKRLCDKILTFSSTEGLFRIGGSVQREKQALLSLSHRDYSFDNICAIDMAVLVKRFIRGIPGGLIPEKFRNLMLDSGGECVERLSRINEASGESNGTRKRTRFASRIRARSPLFHRRSSVNVPEESKETLSDRLLLLCMLMPRLHRDLLAYLLTFLIEISKEEEKNRMSIQNLVIVFTPTLFPPSRSKPPANVLGCIDRESRILSVLMDNHHKIGIVGDGITAKIRELEAKKLDRKPRTLVTVMSNIANGLNRIRRRSRSANSRRESVNENAAQQSHTFFMIGRRLKQCSSQSLAPSPVPDSSKSTSSGHEYVGAFVKDQIRRSSSAALDTAILVPDDDSQAENHEPVETAPLKRRPTQTIEQNKDEPDDKSSDPPKCTPAKRPSFRLADGQVEELASNPITRVATPRTGPPIRRYRHTPRPQRRRDSPRTPSSSRRRMARRTNNSESSQQQQNRQSRRHTPVETQYLRLPYCRANGGLSRTPPRNRMSLQPATAPNPQPSTPSNNTSRESRRRQQSSRRRVVVDDMSQERWRRRPPTRKPGPRE